MSQAVAPFMQIVDLYIWSLLGAVVTAPALALIGAQVLARDWSLRALVVSQASSTGILIGLAANLWLSAGSDAFAHIIVLTSSLLFSLFVAWLFYRYETQHPMSPAYALGGFAGLMTLSTVIAAAAPGVEAGMTAIYAGDIATTSNLESRLNLVVSLAALAWLWRHFSGLTAAAFEASALSLSVPSSLLSHSKSYVSQPLFAFVAVAVLVVALQGFGFVFVIGSLFVTCATARSRGLSLKHYQWRVAGAATLGSAAGFFASLALTAMQVDCPTTPAVLVGQFLAAIALRGFVFKPQAL